MKNNEIKFRAWENNLKEMIHVSDICFESKIINKNSAWRYFDDVILMQYTGRRDKNGKEIYYGDILKYKSDRFVSYMLVDTPDGNFICQNEEEIVGNIYENPEFLK